MNICCKNLVSIRVIYFQFVFPKALTFVHDILMGVSFEIGLGIFKVVIDSDGASLASGSASSLPRVLMRLGSLQSKISIIPEKWLYFLRNC